MRKKKIYFLDVEGKVDTESRGKKCHTIQKLIGMALPLPGAFVIPSNLSNEFLSTDTSGVFNELKAAIKVLEMRTKKEFCNASNPLFLALKLNHHKSAHCFLPEILNIGINDEIAFSDGASSCSRYSLLEIYFTFIKQFGSIALNVPCEKINELIDEYLSEVGKLSEDQLISLIKNMLSLVEARTGSQFPQNPYDQLGMAIKYFASEGQNDEISIIVQEVIMGNFNDTSGSGFFYSLNPFGTNDLYGIYSPKTQIHDLMFTRQTPFQISKLKTLMPNIYEELKDSINVLKENIKEPLEISFIVDKGKLYIWDCAKANLPIFTHPETIINMVDKGMVSKEEGILSVDTLTFQKILYRDLSIINKPDYIARGTPVSPGIVSGRIVLDPVDVEAFKNDPTILVKEHSVPKDVMIKTSGLITAKGSATSHAAIVAKNIGKCCIVGVDNLKISRDKGELDLNGNRLKKGDWITIEGASGKIFKGKIEVSIPADNPNIDVFVSWINEVETNLRVMVNCNHPQKALKARKYGAEGIGLLRTENMFLAEDRIKLIQEVLLNPDIDEGMPALTKIGEILHEDITGIFMVMDGLPVIIRLFDFRFNEVFSNSNGNKNQKDFSQMLWLRGSRLLLKYRHILEMQIESIFRAAINVKKRGIQVAPSILLPYVMNKEEIYVIMAEINRTAKKLLAAENTEFDYKVGVMVEQPRTALILNQIIDKVDFISFGTNDLTHLTFGLSRDDLEQVIRYYLGHSLMENDPFKVIDEDGVGRLIKKAVETVRKLKPSVSIGVCGEHAGNPESIEFFMDNDFDQISCSLNDLLIARLAVAQNEIKKPYIKFDDNKLFQKHCLEKISKELDIKLHSQAQATALGWAKAVSKKYCIDEPVVWKFFKRDVATKWFGRIEHKKFHPNWNSREVMEYMDSFPGKSFRLSIFPEDIACHAVSYFLSLAEKGSWKNIVSSIEPLSSIRVFPVPAYENMCFRLFYSADEFYIEAGIGEAMFVFEAEQGKHPIVLAQIKEHVLFSEKNSDPSHQNKVNDIKKRLKMLIDRHLEDLQIRCEMVRYALGIEYISIEGYYDENDPDHVAVVDLDLPQDVAFVSKQ